MAVLEWIRFLVGAVLMLCGLGIFVVEMIGVFRFKYVLNRMHAAAMGDTLGIGFSLLGLIIMSGLNFTSLKLLFVITGGEGEKHYREAELSELEEERKEEV